MTAEGQQRGPVSCGEVGDRLDKGSREEEEALEGHILAEGDEVDLSVHACIPPGRVHQERRVVVFGPAATIDLVAPEQNRDVRPSCERTHFLGLGAVLFEEKRCGRLGPQNHVDPLIDCLGRQMQVVLKYVRRPPGVPLLRLVYVPLDETDANRCPRPGQVASDQPKVPPDREPDDDQEGHRERHRPFPQAAVAPDRQNGQSRSHARDERRDTVHPGEAGHLDHRQHGHLAVTQQHPREPGQHVRASELSRDPDERRNQQRPIVAGAPQPRGGQRKRGGENREVRDEGPVDEDRGDDVQAPVDHHHACDPVDRPDEEHDAGNQAQDERPPRRLAVERNQERRERDPGKGGMADLGEAERQQQSGDDRQDVVRRTRDHCPQVY